MFCELMLLLLAQGHPGFAAGRGDDAAFPQKTGGPCPGAATGPPPPRRQPRSPGMVPGMAEPLAEQPIRVDAYAGAQGEEEPVAVQLAGVDVEVRELAERAPEPAARPPFLLSRRLFLAALGVVHGIAFLSFWAQVDGLIGSAGILPAAQYLEAARSALGSGFAAVLALPTLAWLSASDVALQAMCALGTLL